MAEEFTAEISMIDRGTDQLAVHTFPAPDPVAPVVVIWPAMGTPARFYRRFAAELFAAGFAPIAIDLRGNGSSTPRPSRASRYGYLELAGDVGAVLEALKLDGRRVYLLGHSLGGQACVLHLGLSGQPVDGLILVAVGLPHFRQYRPRHAIGVLPMTQWISGVSAVLRVWPGWGFGGRQAAGVIRDWGHTARTGRFKLRGVDAEAAVRSITTPVLAVTVDNDQYTPPATTHHLTAKMPLAPVHHHHYTEVEAGGPLDHFGWTRAGGPLAAVIAAWSAGASPPSGVHD